MMRLIVPGLMAITLLSATPAWATLRCVGAPTTQPCPVRYPTIQAAVTAAAAGDRVLVGPGTYTEAVRLTRAVELDYEAGAVHSGKGLRGATLLHFDNVTSHAVVADLTMDVSDAAYGIRATEGQLLTVQNSVISGRRGSGRKGDTAHVGIALHGGRRHALQFVTVSGLDTGIELLNVMFEKVQNSTVIGNGLGIRVRHGKGQVFYSTLRNNAIGMKVESSSHTDINGSTYVADPSCVGCVGVVWGFAPTPHPESGLFVNSVMEMNHTTWIGYGKHPAGRAIAVQKLDGTFTSDYFSDPGCTDQWGHNIIEGEEVTFYTTPPC